MRVAGSPPTLHDLGTHDHACWAFERPDEWQARAVEFLGDGLEQHQQVHYVGRGTPNELAGQLAPLGDVGSLLADGRLVVTSTDDAYGDGIVDPERQVAAFTTVASEGLEAGFAGVRVAADVTALARSAASFTAYARYEHLVDRLIAAAPLTGLCGFDRTVLDADAVERLACLHPVGPPVPFRLFTDEGALVLDGDVDTMVAELFEWALDQVPACDVLQIDAARSGFLDHNALSALDASAVRNDQDVLVRTHSSTPARIADLLGLRRVRLEPAR